MSSGYLPPGWPAPVPGPGTPEFEASAVSWLYEHCPADFRRYAVLRRYPLLLGRLAVEQLTAARSAAREGYRTARAQLADRVPPAALGELLAAYEQEGRRLSHALRGAQLVARALSGEQFTRPL